MNLPSTLKDHLTGIIKEAQSPELHHLLWHLSFLKFCIANWRYYINFLEESSQQIVSRQKHFASQLSNSFSRQKQ